MADTNDKRSTIEKLDDLLVHLLFQCMDPLYPDHVQQRLFASAKALRQRVAQLKRQNFNQATAGYNDAMAAIQQANQALDEAITEINNVVEFIGTLSRLATALDKIIAAALPV